MHIALAGPCTPGRLGHRLDHDEREAAAAYPGFGGTAVIQLADALVGLGHRVTVVTTGEAGAESARFAGKRLEILCVPRRRAGLAIRDGYRTERRDMADALRGSGADLVNSHWTYEFALAARDSGLIHVTTARDAPVTILRHYHDWYRLARLAVAVRVRVGLRELSCVSPYLAGRWRREMAYRRPITITPNPIPSDMLNIVRTPTAHPSVLDVADSGPIKNVKTLVTSAAQVRRTMPELELRLVGDGLGEDGQFASWARRAGLAEGVTFLGHLDRDSLRREYETTWLFVHASLEESFGITVLEAAAAGVPVLAGQETGGVPFVLGQGRAGWLTDVRDPQRLAEEIRQLLFGGPAPVKTGTQDYIETTFASNRVAEEYVRWYHRVLSDGDSGPPVQPRC